MAITLDGTTGINTSGSLTTSSSLTTGTGAIYNGIQSSTAVSTTSGTSVTFTNIPSWVKRITIILNGVSTSGSNIVQVQVGAGSVTTSGYLGAVSDFAASSLSTTNVTTGFGMSNNIGATAVRYGIMTIANISGNNWISSSTVALSGSTATGIGSGYISLGGVLDRVVLTTVGGTDTFDAGSVNILYE